MTKRTARSRSQAPVDVSPTNWLLEDVIRKIINECMEAKIKEVKDRIEEIKDDINDEISDRVNEAMQEFTVDAENIENLDDAVIDIIDGCTVTIGR